MSEIIITQTTKRKISMKRGSDWDLAIYKREDDTVTPVNTTGYSATMTIKSLPNGETLDTLTIGSGITNDEADGKFTYKRTAAEVSAYTFRSAYYDNVIEDASGNVYCTTYGEIEVIP